MQRGGADQGLRPDLQTYGQAALGSGTRGSLVGAVQDPELCLPGANQEVKGGQEKYEDWQHRAAILQDQEQGRFLQARNGRRGRT